MYLCCKQVGVHATFRVHLVDQAEEEQSMLMECTEPQLFGPGIGGWPRFTTHKALRSRPGYLAGDRLMLRAMLQVEL